uniref:Uncharacterized protein n=2 Tax=Nicotiana TaxID=4085 RepID=A0A1S4AF03_TOBAC|nr:PREDICTED: uncharacterized protein LOC107796749 [Nicotiana tabacum]
MELTHGKKDLPNGPPSRLIMYLQSRSLEGKDQVRVIKCHRESNQAFEVYSSIEQARNVYGQSQSKALVKTKMTRPYSPIADVASAEGICTWSPQQMPASTFGSSEQ